MTLVIATILCGIFIAIAALHLFWAFGGKWGAEVAVPSKETGEKLIKPTPFRCAIVSWGMVLMAVLILQYAKLIRVPQLSAISNYAIWIVAFVFLIRSIGDFKYIGFFKKVRNTAFAKNDTKYYSPLCLIIGVLCMSLFLLV